MSDFYALHSPADRTRRAFLSTWLLDTPFWVLFNMLPFILYKDLGASVFQITALVMLKPLSSLLAMYWGAHADGRKDRLVPNVIWSSVLRHLPFLFCPLIDNPYYYIAAFGFHMVLARGTKPAWMEILRSNLPGGRWEKVYSKGVTLSYIGNALLPFALGWLLDSYIEAWRWIFPVTAAVSMIAVVLQACIPIERRREDASEVPTISFSSTQVLKPWLAIKQLLEVRRDFLRFQVGFMLGGAGLMIIQPAIPEFISGTLNLSYTALGVATTTCKGLGFVIASPLCTRLLKKMNIFRFAGIVDIIACLFPLLLFWAINWVGWLYVGYLCYGVMQAGSTLCWGMSGPLFSRDQESSVLYTNINVVTVGIRGIIVPCVGSIIAAWMGIESLFFAGGVLCFLGALYMVAVSRTTACAADVV